MQRIVRMIYGSEELKITDKELSLLYELGLDLIPTATDFVDYFAGRHQISQSGVWYTLKKLKKEGLLDFTEKGEEPRPLGLTDVGMRILRSRVVDVQNRQYHHVETMQV